MEKNTTREFFRKKDGSLPDVLQIEFFGSEEPMSDTEKHRKQVILRKIQAEWTEVKRIKS